MTTISKGALIAPDKLLEAFAVVLHSAENMELIASATEFDALQAELNENIPDVILVYLAEQSAQPGKPSREYEQIEQLKEIWPDAACITIVKDPQSAYIVKELGADMVFYDGVAPSRLLDAIGDLRIRYQDLHKAQGEIK